MKGSEVARVELVPKIEEMTAEKSKGAVLSEGQKIQIRNELFSLFKHDTLRGKIKVQDIQNLS